jgi:citrate synthase
MATAEKAAEKSKGGLEDVVATTSAICYLDGERGVLAYCGYDIHDLAQQATFEEVCYLLWHRRLPTRAELGDLQSQLAAARALPEPIIRLMRSLPPVDGMDALRTLTSALGHYDHEANDASPQAQYRKAVRLTAQTGSIVATWGRLQAGGGPIAPDPAMGHAANFLYMLTGDRPNATAVHAFDVALTLHADHELNASTFAGRVAAATLTDIYSAVVAAIGTLKGPLHGGANAEVMKMLIDLGETATGDRIDEFVKGKFARKEKISGVG